MILNNTGKTDGYFLYGLFDPRNNELKYIGYTKNLKQRLLAHCSKSRLKNNSHKNNWIKSLTSSELEPDVITIEWYETLNDALIAEVELIEYYKSIGCDLTNVTNGGDPGYTYIPSPETRVKISKSGGHKQTVETRAKISRKMKGKKKKPMKESTKQKLREANLGKKIPQEVIEKKSATFKITIANREPYKAPEDVKIKQVAGNKSYKLTQAKIISIRELYSSGDYTQAQLADMFGVSPPHISVVIHHKTGQYLK
jgi:predicted GIY-YIG superfamily endonuclease